VAAGHSNIQIGCQPLLARQNGQQAQAVLPHFPGGKQLGVASAKAGGLVVVYHCGVDGVGELLPLLLGGGAQIKRLNADKQRQHQNRIPAGQAVLQGIHGIHHHAGRYQIEHPPAGAEDAAQLQQLCRQRQLNAGVAPVNFVADGKQR